ncbi:hypothetical protein TNCV_1350361 [Trichonephila clavipes]|nr:hypothetical protein TNCV_1350361 [Trichonephila clavipes]
MKNLDEIRSSEKFSPVMQLSNISGSSDQISTPSSETTLVKSTKYTFYDDNGEKFIIDNADFEEEEEELIDIFKSNSALVSNYPNFKIDSYNENFHFVPIASSDNHTDNNDDKQKVAASVPNTNPVLRSAYNRTEEGDVKENVVASTPNINTFLPIATDAPSDNRTDEDEDEEHVVSVAPKKTFLKR